MPIGYYFSGGEWAVTHGNKMAYALPDFEPAPDPHRLSPYASPRVRMAQGKLAIAEVRVSQAEADLRLVLVETQVSCLEKRLSHLEAELHGLLLVDRI